jgi:hypothetical protein
MQLQTAFSIVPFVEYFNRELWKNKLIRKFKFHRKKLTSEAIVAKRMKFGRRKEPVKTVEVNGTLAVASQSPMKRKVCHQHHH